MAKNDSKEQLKQKQQNITRQSQSMDSMDTNGDGNFDKKLDGPNRPAE